MIYFYNRYQDTSGFGRVPDPPYIEDECEYDDFNEDNCYFCTNFANCKEEYERENNNGADTI